MIQFEKTGNIVPVNIPRHKLGIRPKAMNWGNTALRLEVRYEKGCVQTFKGTQVPACNLVEDSLTIELFDRVSQETIHKPKAYFNQFNFDLTYNCHGYCFAESKVIIEDPTQFIVEEYEEVDSTEAEVIMFKGHQRLDDNGEKLFDYVHAVRILSNGKVSFKPGINQLVKNANMNLAIHDYDFNHKVYFRKKT